MTGQAETIRSCVAMLARLPIGISLKDWSDVSGNLLDAAAYIDRLEAINAELLEAAKKCRLELDFCQKQLAAHGQTGHPDDSVSRALTASAKAIASAQRIIGESE